MEEDIICTIDDSVIYIYYNIKQLVRLKKGVKIITNVFLFIKKLYGWYAVRQCHESDVYLNFKGSD